MLDTGLWFCLLYCTVLNGAVGWGFYDCEYIAWPVASLELESWCVEPEGLREY